MTYRSVFTTFGRVAALGVAGLALALPALAQEAPTVQDAIDVSAFVDNSYLFLISGLVVMFMAAGFCMLEAGLVRQKNAAMQSTKNIALFSIAGIMFWLVGYQLLYPGDWLISFGPGGDDGPTFGLLGEFKIWDGGDATTAGLSDTSLGYSSHSDWYFQMVFVATCASIVSGTVAERVKLFPFLIFVAVLCGIIYPIQCSWQWSGTGWLADLGFSDFAGSTLVHSVGGWAALAGALVIGPRTGKYFGKRVNPLPGSNIPLAALGTFILWFGWFGFNGGSVLAAGDASAINSVAKVFANTNMAAAGGVVAALLLCQGMYGKVDPTLVFNGAIGGLVAITAEPLAPSMHEAVLIGGVGGILVVLTVPLLDKLKIDDVVGAIPAHLVAGIWGTLIVALNTPVENEAGDKIGYAFSVSQLGTQVIGIAAIGAFVFLTSLAVWLILKVTIGVRVSPEDELDGLDKAELGVEAYPEFART